MEVKVLGPDFEKMIITPGVYVCFDTVKYIRKEGE